MTDLIQRPPGSPATTADGGPGWCPTGWLFPDRGRDTRYFPGRPDYLDLLRWLFGVRRRRGASERDAAPGRFTDAEAAAAEAAVERASGRVSAARALLRRARRHQLITGAELDVMADELVTCPWRQPSMRGPIAAAGADLWAASMMRDAAKAAERAALTDYRRARSVVACLRRRRRRHGLFVIPGGRAPGRPGAGTDMNR